MEFSLSIWRQFSRTIHGGGRPVDTELCGGDEANEIRPLFTRQYRGLRDHHWEVIPAGNQQVVPKDVRFVFGLAKRKWRLSAAQQLRRGAVDLIVGNRLQCLAAEELARPIIALIE